MEDEHPSGEGRAAEQGCNAQKGSTGNNSLASPKHAHLWELGTDDPGLQHWPRSATAKQTGTSKNADGEGGDRRKSGQIPEKKPFYSNRFCWTHFVPALPRFQFSWKFKQLNQDFTLHFRPTCSPPVSVLICMVCIHTFVSYINQWHYAMETTPQKFMLLVEQHYFSSEYWTNTQLMRTYSTPYAPF